MIAARDWAATALGPIKTWPQSLVTATMILLRSPVPVVMLWGPTGVMLYNDAYSRFAGARHPELLGSNVLEGWPEVADFNQHVLNVGLAGGTLSYRDQELTLYRNSVPEQVWMNLDYSPVLDESGEPAGVLCILGETTERMKADAALRANEAKLRDLNETLEAQVAARSAERDRLWNLSQDMLARANFDGMMSAVSPAWTNILGWDETVLLTRPYAAFMHPDDTRATLEAIEAMSTSGQPARFENRIATADGAWKPIEWTVTPEPDSANFIAIGRDLSLTKARDAELEIAQDALRQSQKMEAMGQLTGGVAHDFNNLLTPIIGSLDMLLRKGVGNDRERRLIDGGLQSAERAKTLVQRLLAFARRQPLQPAAVDVRSLVTDMKDLVTSTTGPTISVRVEMDAMLPFATADANQLEMAVLNLAVNARDAMPDGGELVIGAQCQTLPISTASLRRGDYIVMSVRDTGIGMDDATVERAIEPFFSTKGVGKGTGLGLSMVHGLAAQLGGGLNIISKPGLGTTVELWLPASGGKVAPLPAQVATAPSPSARGTALLVDDEELVRISTADMLADFGFDVLEAASAEEALKIVQSGVIPDLLVTDYFMPGLNGAQLVEEARSIDPTLPVLILSGYADVDGIAPGTPRLTKPFRNAELEAAISAVLSPAILSNH